MEAGILFVGAFVVTGDKNIFLRGGSLSGIWATEERPNLEPST